MGFIRAKMSSEAYKNNIVATHSLIIGHVGKLKN